jgi:hypothetical protein
MGSLRPVEVLTAGHDEQHSTGPRLPPPDPLDSGSTEGDAPAMTENPYAIPAEELVNSARVPAAEQVEAQAEPQQPPGDWSSGPLPYGDGMSGDADGD